MTELENKVLNEKYTKIDHTVKKPFQNIIEKCLKKKAENRPSLEDLIMMDEF